MKKKLPIILYKKESRSKTILLLVVSLGLIASLLFQMHLLRELDYLWTELDETYELLLGVLEHLQNAQFSTQPYI